MRILLLSIQLNVGSAHSGIFVHSTSASSSAVDMQIHFHLLRVSLCASLFGNGLSLIIPTSIPSLYPSFPSAIPSNALPGFPIVHNGSTLGTTYRTDILTLNQIVTVTISDMTSTDLPVKMLSIVWSFQSKIRLCILVNGVTGPVTKTNCRFAG